MSPDQVKLAEMVAAFVLVIVLAVAHRLLLRLFGVVLIPQDSIGIVNKKYVVAGKNRSLPDGSLVALNGEAGIQADTLAPGVHFWLWPWQFEITRQKFVTIKEEHVGVVESRDGRPLPVGRVLAPYVDCDSFQSARQFLANGGYRGTQIAVIPPGTYRINTMLFTVSEEEALEVADNMVGIVTTEEGASLSTGDIAGREIPGHDSFQNGDAFIRGGGTKGLQEQVILAGRYFVNPRFVTVEVKEMTQVPIANVGVVISFVGTAGVDVSGEAFKHGNLVSRGQKGVWVDPLDPGKYPINPYTHKVETVPTANVVLNWATGKTEAHNLDKNLSTITVRSSDGFQFNLDVSQIIHISRNDAPKVIARFGTVANLVTQVLEPTIGNYFRNAAQGSDVIEFLKSRQERQFDAKKQISAALTDYNIVAVDTLIGDIVPPPTLMETLTQRKIAEQQQKTFQTQKLAEDQRKDLQQAKAMADTQPQVVTSERAVTIAEFNAKASIAAADGAAQATVLQANAEAQRTNVVGNAEAARTRAIGTAEADVIKMKVASMDQKNFAGVEIARALATSGFKLVPDVLVGGGGENADSGGLISVLLAGMIRDQMLDRRNGDRRNPPAPGTNDVGSVIDLEGGSR